MNSWSLTSIKSVKLFIAIFACSLVFSSACATKKYVRNQVNDRVTPVEGRTSELEESSKDLKNRTGELENGQAKLRSDLSDVDSRATAGITDAKERANEADRQAHLASDQARANGTRVDNLDTWEEAKQVVVNFKINQAKLTDEEKAKLDELAAQIKSEKGYVIEIRGFTDIKGGAQHNQTLSEARAKAVFQYMAAQHDIPSYKMNIVGFGNIKPVADNSTREGRAENRRVEVKLLMNTGIRQTPAAQPADQGNDNNTLMK